MYRPALMIAFGRVPSPLAHERDEDSLDRERDHGDDEHDGDEHGQDAVRAGIEAIVEGMHERGRPAVDAARALGQALLEMADAFTARNDARLKEAVDDACAAIHEIGQEGEDDGER